MPADEKPILVHSQGMKLHSEIQKGISASQEQRSKLRMLLSARDFQTFFQRALDHFCSTIDQPFDFAKASFSSTRTSSAFSQNLLSLATAMINIGPRLKASSIFERLSLLTASCIMLDTVRHEVRGAADRVFPNYVSQLDLTLEDFCYNHWPCEFHQRGMIKDYTQGGWGTNYMIDLDPKSVGELRCSKVHAVHGTRGHQLKDGRFFAAGNFMTSFSLEDHRTAILNRIYYRLHYLMELLSSQISTSESLIEVAARIHREHVLRPFFSQMNDLGDKIFQHTKYCVSCLFEPAHHILSCGHSFCKHCINAYGNHTTNSTVEVDECPLHTYSPTLSRVRIHSVHVKPDEAGMRILFLEDGGVQSVVQLELLKMIEKELRGRIGVQSLFDLIIGEGTGGILALGLGSRGWTVDDCERHMLELLDKCFSSSAHRRFPGISFRRRQYGSWKYHSKPLEEGLKDLFTPHQSLVDQAPEDLWIENNAHVAVVTRMVGGKPAVFTNHPTKSTHCDLKLWQAARATMSNKTLFKPLIHPHLGPLHTEKSNDGNQSLKTALIELNDLGEPDSSQPYDTILSLRCCAISVGGVSALRKEIEDVIGKQQFFSVESGYIRFRVQMNQLPKADELKSINLIKNQVHFQINQDDVAQAVTRLLTNLLYVETVFDGIENSNRKYLVLAQLRCRLPDNSKEIREFGKMFLTGRFRRSAFVFGGDGCPTQRFSIPIDVIEDWIQKREFHMPKFKIYVTERRPFVYGVLELESEKEYPLSGFPRQLITNDERKQTASGGNNGASNSANQPSWQAPSLHEIPSLENLSLTSLRRLPQTTTNILPIRQEQQPSDADVDETRTNTLNPEGEITTTTYEPSRRISNRTRSTRRSMSSQRSDQESLVEMRERIGQLENELQSEKRRLESVIADRTRL
jgi:hypothetical protein